MSDKVIQAAINYLQLLDEAERSHDAAADQLVALAKHLDGEGQPFLATALLSIGRQHRVGALQANAQVEAVKVVVAASSPEA